MVDPRRVRVLRPGEQGTGPVVYVMGRDFRAHDNWALLYAAEQARAAKVPLGVLVHFGKNFIATNARQHRFLIEGLKEVAGELESLNIPFFITMGDWKKEVAEFVSVHQVGLLVTDFSPLHEMRWWWDEVAHGVTIPVHEVDAHNIIPCWIASPKEEFAAHTFRPKVRRLYASFRGAIPKTEHHPIAWGASQRACWPRGYGKQGCMAIDWDGVEQMKRFESIVSPVTWCKPGPKAGAVVLQQFIKERLSRYDVDRNDPTKRAISDLSPYIRFGYVSTQRIAHEIEKVRRDHSAKAAFLEELVVRRELAENFCFYNDSYDSFSGLKPWAQETLAAHRNDVREYTYTFEQFERAMTHDPLWNAAQLEMVHTGKMHGYMRMYWAKKILEWTRSPEEAIEIAIALNDRYELDGGDPNGYVGVLWSIGGIHDRAWSNRPVFGKIRYMNYNGCKRKFDVKTYIEKHAGSTATLF